ncbi:MAG TPA: DUF3305 domain-containing protein [Geminicoccaceae bacterium]|nr:DUF3305 domain-containing protein [Geminicoccaceae bacterium]
MFEVVATHPQAMERSVRMALGVVVERRKSTSRWQDWSWRPVSVIPGAPPVGAEWRELLRGEAWTHYHAANLPLELHRSETEAYLLNLSQHPPRIYVVLRPITEPGPYAYRPLLITASPAEAEGYLSSGEEIVEGVPMPAPVIAWLRDFVDRHHVERPFVKRKRGKGTGPRSGAERGGWAASADRAGSDDDG